MARHSLSFFVCMCILPVSCGAIIFTFVNIELIDYILHFTISVTPEIYQKDFRAKIYIFIFISGPVDKHVD